MTGLTVGALAVFVGLVVGLLGAASRGWSGRLAMRLVDLALVLPFFPLVLLLGAYVGGGQLAVVLLLAAVLWAGPARVIRARALSVLQEPYVDAAVATGGGKLHILFYHVWPAVRDIVAV